MKAKWKVLITIGVAVFFILVIVITLALVGNITIISGNNIAIIPIKGEITMGGCGGSIFGSVQCAQVSKIKGMIEDSNKDNSVRAIILDIDSGGGSVVASRELMRTVKESKKPVVAWIGESGASGAYYVASAADKIIADRDSITGSIGVLMSIQHYYELFGKIGINTTVIKAGDTKDIGSPYRPMTDEEKKELQDILDRIYDDFIIDVANNRNLSINYVRNISKGNIYLGSQAKDLDLIDEVGGFDDAVKTAAELAGIRGKPKLKEVKAKNTVQDLLSGVSSDIGEGIGRSIIRNLR